MEIERFISLGKDDYGGKPKMKKEESLIVFQDKKIRRIWHNNEWYFSVIDIAAVLTEKEDFQTARKYWNKLSQRLREEGSEVVTNCHRLKLPAEDGKLRETDYTNIRTSNWKKDN